MRAVPRSDGVTTLDPSYDADWQTQLAYQVGGRVGRVGQPGACRNPACLQAARAARARLPCSSAGRRCRL